MSFNTIGQWSSSPKPWDHQGHVIPTVEGSEGDRPSINNRPAAWLPVQFYERQFEDWIVCMPGKIVGFDPQGLLVPQQYMLGSSTVTYTTSDVTAGVLDVRTGVACTSASVSASPITLSGVTAWMGVSGTTWAILPPAGVCMYPWLKWYGDGSSLDNGTNPLGLQYQNYNPQNRVAIVCDYALELPVVPASATAQTLTVGARTGTTHVCNALSNLPVAKNTVRTAITISNGSRTDASTRFVNQVDTAAEVVSLGDWHINLTTGVISFYSATTLTGTYTIAYSHYASAPASVSVFASVVGNPQPGDLLKSDANSNWTVATPKVISDGVTDAFDNFAYIMGQCIGIESQPNAYLDRVRTGWASLGTSATGALPGTAGQLDQLPGSATGGVSDKVHYAGAADLVALVNMVSR